MRNVRRSGIALASVVAISTPGLAIVLASPAAAAGTFRYVATDGDDGASVVNDCTDPANPCLTIRHAVDEAEAGDTVNVAAGTYAESVLVAKDVTIAGAGVGQSIVEGDGENSYGIDIDGRRIANNTVTLQDLSVDGNSVGSGIVVFSATLHLIDSSASQNDDHGLDVEASDAGPATATINGSRLSGNSRDGLRTGLAIDSGPSSVTVEASYSTLSNNGRAGITALATTTLSVDGSAVSANSGGGVVLQDDSSATMDSSSVDGNLGGGVVALGAGTTATITRSTVSNSQPFASTDSPRFGSGVLVSGGQATVSNSTIVGNTGQGVLSLDGSVAVAASTVTGTKPAADSSFDTGGLVLDGAATGPSLTVSASIVADQDVNVPDCAGSITDTGYNLSSDAANSCSFSVANNDLASTDPLLGALADNGGPTLTEAPQSGASPALDKIPSDSAACMPTDQRGTVRPQGQQCDIGAVEVTQESTGPIITAPTDQTISNDAGSCGAVVDAASLFTVTGDPTPTLTVTPTPPGNLYPVGTTTVTGTATSTNGAASASFDLTINDTENPTAHAPANLTTNATSPAGAVVTFTVSATDNCPGASAQATPQSGTTFPVGTTTVHVTATDAANNTATASFTVTVSGAVAQASALAAAVQGIAPGSALANKMKQVQADIAANNISRACSDLDGFIALVKAQKDKKIKAQANTLIAAAQAIKQALGC